MTYRSDRNGVNDSKCVNNPCDEKVNTSFGNGDGGAVSV